MTENEEEAAARVVETCRKAHRKAAELLAAKGVRIEDSAIGALYAAHDIAIEFRRDPHGAIEWLRDGLDMMERQLLERQARRH